MKKIITVFCIAFLSLNTYAQRAGFDLEPIIGLGYTGLTNSNINSANGTIKLKIGCNMDLMLNDHWGFSTGLQLQSFGCTNIIDYGNNFTGNYNNYYSYTANWNENATYIQMPLMARVITSQDDKVGYFAELGIVLGVPIGSSETGSVTEYQSSYISGNTVEGYYNINTKADTKFTQWIRFGTGLVIPCSEKVSLIAEAQIDVTPGAAINSDNDVAFFNNSFNYTTYNYSEYENYYLASASFCVKVNIKLGSSK